ncbi:MAG: type II secretion system protein [Candidatus Wallbacteria bacterium]|nr:type II secretion system protein [Candidatus Wallbacteria bacterium]
MSRARNASSISPAFRIECLSLQRTGDFFLLEKMMKRCGITLIELLMVVLIISVMASVAIPLGKIQFVRGKEEDLKQFLKDFRRGIDQFYDHNTNEIIGFSGNTVDDDIDGMIDEEINDGIDNDGDGAIDEDLAASGYPKSLKSMVINHWLRHIPKEPLGNKWQYRTPTDPPGTWRDFADYGNSYSVTNLATHSIYDIRTDGSYNNNAIDGTNYNKW